MNKKLLSLFVVSGVLITGLYLYFTFNNTVSITDYAMNTQITITAKGKNAKKAVSAALDEVDRIDSLMSTTVSESDICRINSAEPGTEVKVSDEVYSLIELALDVSNASDGAFDISVNPLSELWNIASPEPSVPTEERIAKSKEAVGYEGIVLNSVSKTVSLQKEGMSISLGAIAKGYAADRVCTILKNYKVRDAIADLGGNVYVLGEEKKVGIQTPFADRGEYFTVCSVSDASVVTSGAYERYFEEGGKIYHHIIDPATGYPAESGIKSCTVISKNSALADALSTALFVAGEKKARDIVPEYEGVRVILLTDDGRTVEIDN